MQAELLWWEGCPSTERALRELRAVLREEGLDPESVRVRQVSTDARAADEGFVGSPTVRIEGVDVAPPSGEAAGLTCRVYHRRDGRVSPTPDPEDVRDAIRKARL